MRGKVARALRHYTASQYAVMTEQEKDKIDRRKMYRYAKVMYKGSKRRKK